MIKFENTEVMGWEAAIRGMRNPKNSWERSDSGYCCGDYKCVLMPECDLACDIPHYYIGPNDLDLMRRLADGGPVHAKYRRMITVYVDITAPLYWWKEFDTYKVGTVANSCSTMHKIAAKEFMLEDFSHDHLGEDSLSVLQFTINHLNRARDIYLETKDKDHWWQMIQLLPSSYNQKRTVMLNYEVLAGIYPMRKNHKLDEWAEHESVNITNGEKVVRTIPNQYFGFCDWIRTLPYSELITGRFHETNDSEVIK